MISVSVGFIACVAVAYGSVALLRALLYRDEGVRDGTRFVELEGNSVHVLASLNTFETSVPVTVPLDAIHGLRYQARHRCYEFGGYISSEDLPDQSRRLPAREIAVNVSVWRNAPALRTVLGERLRARARSRP